MCFGSQRCSAEYQGSWGRDLIHEAIHIADRAIVRILANGKGATIGVVVDVLLIIEGRGVREDCHADAKQTHMKWRPRGEGTQGGMEGRERTLRRRMSVPTLAHSLNIRTEADDRAERDATAVGRE